MPKSRAKTLTIGILMGLLLSGTVFAYKRHVDKEKVRHAKEICRPSILYDIALIGQQEYAVCEVNNRCGFNLEPLN